MFSRITYRIWQSWKNLTASLSDQDREAIRQVLSPQEYQLFRRMSEADQAHSFRVYRSLKVSGEVHPDLLTAALLHDVGKSGRFVPVWERTAAVLLKPFLKDSPDSPDEPLPAGLRRAVSLSRRHPDWGADLAQDAGAGPLAVRLIRYHQSTPERFPGNDRERELLVKLIQADNQN